MSSQARQSKFTYEDYLLFPDDRQRHELIDGDHYVTPSPTTKHQRISLKLSTTLTNFLRRSPLGEVFAAPYDVVLSDLDVVQPDLLFIAKAHASLVTDKNIRGAPDLVIEILSETTRKTDELVKRKLYERYGVSEYWIVDPELETVKVCRLTDQGYGRIAELTREAGDALSTPLLPGLQIPLIDIFA